MTCLFFCVEISLRPFGFRQGRKENKKSYMEKSDPFLICHIVCNNKKGGIHMSNPMRTIKRNINRNRVTVKTYHEPDECEVTEISLPIKRLNPNVVEIEIGYRPFTTFYDDLSIVELFRNEAIKETYEEIIRQWICDVKYFTEFVMMLNWKCEEWYNRGNIIRAGLYQELHYEAMDKALEVFDEEELKYFWKTLD